MSILLIWVYVMYRKGVIDFGLMLNYMGLIIGVMGLYVIPMDIFIVTLSLCLIFAGGCKRKSIGIDFNSYFYNYLMALAELIFGIKALSLGVAGLVGVIQTSGKLVYCLLCYCFVLIGLLAIGSSYISFRNAFKFKGMCVSKGVKS